MSPEYRAARLKWPTCKLLVWGGFVDHMYGPSDVEDLCRHRYWHGATRLSDLLYFKTQNQT